MKTFAARIPLYVGLLPVFFVFHRWVENIGYVSFSECVPLMGIYLLATGGLYLLFFLLMKDAGKAALISFYILCFYFFFGVVHDFLRKYGIFLHRYTVLLPAFVTSVVLLALALRKRTRFTRITLFLNLLLVIYLLTDAITLLTRWSDRRPPASMESALAKRYPVSDSCPRPDIYLLLFDEYASSAVLRDRYGYDNSALDSFLSREGFTIVRGSRSNYNFTPFSMASILDMSYLPAIRDPMRVEGEDYLNAMEQIRKAEAVKFLAANGYDIVNYSPFDIPGHPLTMDQTFIPANIRLITYSTLYNYIRRDAGATLDKWFFGRLSFASYIHHTDSANQRFLAQTQAESRKKGGRPRFVYMHVMMPHLPYYYDSLGHERSEKELAQQIPNDGPSEYLQYVAYTNTRIRELIGSIRENTGGRAVILFLSDHGWRWGPQDKRQPWFFANQNAVYFPDGNGTGFYPGVSAVNELRITFNKMFRLNLPLLADSSIFLHDAPGHAPASNAFTNN